jgi:hypothetical protein
LPSEPAEITNKKPYIGHPCIRKDSFPDEKIPNRDKQAPRALVVRQDYRITSFGRLAICRGSYIPTGLRTMYTKEFSYRGVLIQ